MSTRKRRLVRCVSSTLFLWTILHAGFSQGQVLDPRKLLDGQTFWDNKDWDWYKANIPFFESPDADLDTTYYYRWELLTKHLTYGSTATGYTFTEFMDRPFWSGRYGAISCPAGHQLYEARWLKDPRVARDFARYWFKTPGAQPRNYSTWLADAVWARHLVQPEDGFITALLPDLVSNYEGWEKTHFVPEVGLFWQTGHDDGMEFNINSRQTKDILRGAPGYRPTINSYLWADARAIALVADLAGDAALAGVYRKKAEGLKTNLLKKLWDPKRSFFFPMFRDDEEKNGAVNKKGSLTYQTGPYAGSPHGREEIGYVPWQFGLVDPDAGRSSAWKFLMDPEYFAAPHGPTVTERHDPLFLVTKSCCYWSGQSWPYATTQTLKGLANLLQCCEQDSITRGDYLKLLQTYARTHRKGGLPYLAEAADPDSGSFEGYDAYNHSEHYFHSGYIDLVVTGLAGLRPRADEILEVDPLAPADWPYFALDDVGYRGRRVSIVWDREGDRYGLGKGLHLLADGKKIAHSERLAKLSAPLPPVVREQKSANPPVNFAVNNEGGYYPRVTASFTNPKTPLGKVVDGNSWYHLSPPNRATFEGSRSAEDWVVVDFGVGRKVDTVKLFLLDDGERVKPPRRVVLEQWNGKAWEQVAGQARTPKEPMGRRANVIRFPEVTATRLRATFAHEADASSGLSEFEAWGDGRQSLEAAAPPSGNLAFNPGDRAFPKASASFTSPFDRVERVNDGVITFNANPNNRWTSYQSKSTSDWLAIDFGQERELGRVELAIYDDQGGVQAPASYSVEAWNGEEWREIAGQRRMPEQPAGGAFNEVRFPKVKTSKVRVVFTHKGDSRSGLSEILAWPE